MTTLSATGQVLGGRYHLDRWVAGGVMGEVWEASDSRMERTVAVKVLRPAHLNDPIALERFRYEAQLGAKLDHPGIAKVHDVSVAPGGEPPWLVQEFVDGESLAQTIQRTAPMDPATAAHLVAQAADAAHAAHSLGVVHRDLTPKNLLVAQNDTVKVTDFGIARADALPSLTMTGQVVGTPAYLSPEQVKGEPATAVSDVYSLAVVLYECLAGTRPFAGSNPIDVARAHLDCAPALLPTFVPAPLAAFVMRCLAKEPSARPRSADEFARQLQALVAAPDSRAGEPIAETQTRHIAPVRYDRPMPRQGSRARRSVSPLEQVRSHVEDAWDRVRPMAERAWSELRPEISTVAHRAWRNRPATTAGLAGSALLILAIVAVLLLGDAANGGLQ